MQPIPTMTLIAALKLQADASNDGDAYDEATERVFSLDGATPADCLAVAKLAMSDALTCSGQDDLEAMVGIIDGAVDACPRGPTKAAIIAMSRMLDVLVKPLLD